MIRFNLKETLNNRNKNLNDLAKETGISNTDLDKIYWNRTTTIELDQLERIASILDCPITTIIDYRPEEKVFSINKINFSYNNVSLDFSFQLNYNSNFHGIVKEIYTGKLTSHEVRVNNHLTTSLLFNLSPDSKNNENLILRILNEAEKKFVIGNLINELIYNHVFIIHDLMAIIQATCNNFLSIYSYTPVFTRDSTSIIVETRPTTVSNLINEGLNDAIF